MGQAGAAGGGLVRSLLGTILAGILGCGCLITNPPDNEEPDFHPYFMFMSPYAVTEINKADRLPDGAFERFEVTVADGNVDQRLGYRWFLNYNETNVARCGNRYEYREEVTGIPERQSTSFRLIEESLLMAGRCNRLTLVVTDSEWLYGPLAGCAEVEEGANRLVADWFLLVYDNSTSSGEVSFNQCMGLLDSPEEDPLDDEG